MDHWVISEQAMFDYGGYSMFLGYLKRYHNISRLDGTAFSKHSLTP